MTLELFSGLVIAKGEYSELAAYTGMLLDILRTMSERLASENAKKEANTFADFMNMTFEELMKRENNNNEEEDHD